MPSLHAFTKDEQERAKLWLATQVASMMGRKLEEGDWSRVYCRAKGIPETAWSNLHIDVNYQGLGLEMKLLRITKKLNGKPIKSVCGTSLMHPAATRSIRISDISRPASEVMEDVFRQYAELIEERAARVREGARGKEPDMRVGWLLWESTLTEFLYFEERLVAPSCENFFAEWHENASKGARKSSKNLWIYDRATGKKRYSVTTSAGVKIQPYFDVPPPSDENLYYFRAQSEPADAETVRLWISAATARALESRLGSLQRAVVSAAIVDAAGRAGDGGQVFGGQEELAVGVDISRQAHTCMAAWNAVSDEHRARLLLQALS